MIEIANGETDKTSAFKDIDKELDDLTQVINDLGRVKLNLDL